MLLFLFVFNFVVFSLNIPESSFASDEVVIRRAILSCDMFYWEYQFVGQTNSVEKRCVLRSMDSGFCQSFSKDLEYLLTNVLVVPSTIFFILGDQSGKGEHLGSIAISRHFVRMVDWNSYYCLLYTSPSPRDS